MVRIYYNIFAKQGVLPIVEEQISLIEKHFNFDYELNIGICLENEIKVLDDICHFLRNKKRIIRDLQTAHSEWCTLNLIEGDKEKFQDSDIIIYIHTKGITHFDKSNYNSIVTWRQMMNYFLLEKIDNIKKILDNKNYNVYGVSKHEYDWDKPFWFMTGNFWAVSGEYAKSVDTRIGDRTIRTDVENRFWGLGKNPLIYEAYPIRKNIDFNNTYFKREDYEIK
jgi:hypothetical protein